MTSLDAIPDSNQYIQFVAFFYAKIHGIEMHCEESILHETHDNRQYLVLVDLFVHLLRNSYHTYHYTTHTHYHSYHTGPIHWESW